MAFKNGDRYKRSDDGVVFVFQYMTPRAVMLQAEEGGFLYSVSRRDFDSQFQEVKASGRKAASSRK